MTIHEEYGAAHFVLAGIRKNTNATDYDPPYPDPSSASLSENTALAGSQSTIDASLRQEESPEETHRADHICGSIAACLSGKRIRQRGLVPANA